MKTLDQSRIEVDCTSVDQSLTWNSRDIMGRPQVMQPDEAITLAIKLAAVKAEEASWDAEVAGPTPAHVGSGAAPSHQPIQLVRSLLPRQLQHPARLQQAARDYQAPVLNQWTRNFIR